MLNENAIDRLIQPLIDRQEYINRWVLMKIAKTMKEIGEITPSQVYQIENLYKSGADITEINKFIAVQTALQMKEIRKIIIRAAEESYLDTRKFYEYSDKTFIPFEENRQLQKTVQAIERQTEKTYTNMAKAQAFMVRDPSNPKVFIPTPPAKTYQKYVDIGIQKVVTNVSSYTESIRQSIIDLNNSGIRYVTYNTESGRTYRQRLDTAVRRNILDGIRAVNQGVNDVTGEQFGADGVEISVHMNPAPDHEEIQGHQFKKSEVEKIQNGMDFYDIQGRVYTGFERAIGTWNCRHFMFNIIIGHATPNYTDEQLKEIIKKNHAGYTAPDGKHFTMYECTQMQRQMETEVRRLKDAQMVAKTAGNDELAKLYRARVVKRTKEYEQFSRSCGLSIKRQKMTVPNYRP